MTVDEYCALYTNPGAINHPLDGAELSDIIGAALAEQRKALAAKIRGLYSSYGGAALDLADIIENEP